MDTDRIWGTAQHLGGKVADAVGRATGDHGLRAEGLVDEALGGARALYGQAKDELRGAGGLGREIGEHPLAGLMIAGAVGDLVGLLVPMRR